MNARRFISIVFLATLALGLTACGHDEPELAEANLKPLSVEVAEVERITEAHPIEVRGVVQPAGEAGQALLGGRESGQKSKQLRDRCRQAWGA